MGLKVIEQPASEPLTIEECRSHLRVEPYAIDSDGVGTHPDDALIMAMQSSAREYCENFTGLSLAQKTYELALDAFPGAEIELLMPPVVSVSSVLYIDSAGDVHQVDGSSYVVDNYQRPGWLLPVSGFPWPSAGTYTNAVKIQYVAGFGADSDSEPLPYAARAAMLMMLGHLYANREAVSAGNGAVEMPLSVEALLRPLRIRLGFA